MTANNPNTNKYTIITACNSTETAHSTKEMKGISSAFLSRD